MFAEISFPLSGEYRTGRDLEQVVFYINALTESNQLDLLLECFRSSSNSVLAYSFAKFISNGGKVRMVVNHRLSESRGGGNSSMESSNASVRTLGLTSERSHQLYPLSMQNRLCAGHRLAFGQKFASSK